MQYAMLPAGTEAPQALRLPDSNMVQAGMENRG